MMKKTFKQLLGLTLSAAMVIGMAGCGNDTPTNNTETQVVSKETETTQTKESETQVVEEELTYPLNSDETITMWTHRLTLNSDYKSWEESPFHTGLSEKVGVKFEFKFPNEGQSSTDAYNLLMTEDVLPDVIFRAESNSNLTELEADGVIYDLTPYLEEYAPDYWAAITSNPEIWRNVVNVDGKVLGFWSIKDEPVITGGPQIRKDWLDEQDLEMPVTMEDWEKVLTVFKEEYNATLGYAATFFNTAFFASGAGAFQTSQCKYFIDDNGKVQAAVLQPEWIEYMKILNKWFEAGLIDNDSVTMDVASVRTKAANNQIGASWGALSQITNFNTDAEATGSGSEWVGAGYPRSAADAPTNWIEASGLVITSAACITTSCPEDKLITVIKALNYGYTEEGAMFWNFGEEGETYTINSAGEPEWTDLVLNDPQGLNGAATRYGGASSAPIGYQLATFTKMKNSQAAADAIDVWRDNTEAYDHYLQGLALTVDESAVYTDAQNALSTYISEMAQKFLMGTESLDDDNIAKFYEQLKIMKIEECVAIQQAAYDRYLAK